jgi:hypothetical protein
MDISALLGVQVRHNTLALQAPLANHRNKRQPIAVAYAPLVDMVLKVKQTLLVVEIVQRATFALLARHQQHRSFVR